MKKNLMSVLILALLVVNIVISAIIMVTLVPQTKQANKLITEVCTALNLEIASGRTANLSSVSIEDIVVYDLEDSITVNLTDSPNGDEHYAVVSISLSYDKTNPDYETLEPLVAERVTLIRETVRSIVTKYTYEEIKNDISEPEALALERIQGLFDPNFIIAVNLGATFQ